MNLAGFLLARITEDEATASHAAEARLPILAVVGLGDGPFAIHVARWRPARVLAECEAKRQLANMLDYMGGWNDRHQQGVTEHEIRMMRTASTSLMRLLALPYADHEDYRPEWRP